MPAPGSKQESDVVIAMRLLLLNSGILGLAAVVRAKRQRGCCEPPADCFVGTMAASASNGRSQTSGPFAHESLCALPPY